MLINEQNQKSNMTTHKQGRLRFLIMLLTDAAAFIKTFIEDLNEFLTMLRPDAQLTRLQKQWFIFCLTGILLTNGINWTKFKRCSLGKYTVSGLSWMFRHGKIPWNLLLIASVKMILLRNGITEGQLVIDEVDRARSKSTRRIHKTYKQKHKTTGGYVNGQTVIGAHSRFPGHAAGTGLCVFAICD